MWSAAGGGALTGCRPSSLLQLKISKFISRLAMAAALREVGMVVMAARERASWTEYGQWLLTVMVDDESGRRSMAAGAFNGVGGIQWRQRWRTAMRRGQRGRRSHNNQIKEEAAFGRPPMLSNAQSVGGGHLRDVGNDASAGLWGCSVVGAAAAVHPWGAGSSASMSERRRWRLPTRWRRRWR